MLRKGSVSILILLISICSAWAKEGMWIPTLLTKYNIEEMKQMGFRLNAEDIYSVNHASMKDAVVLFGSGCTGELISNEGLLITNHHCGFDAIQNHSSVEHDYLTGGFWAKNHQEELPNPELTVRFLSRMEDVTVKVLANTEGLPKDSVSAVMQRNTKQITEEATEKGKYEATVQPLFYGNQYFLYVYQVFQDVRLVGAPPSSVGKFGGDTDNWIWPRHTGDFSIFRIYADKNNQPAKYSPDNVPYKPGKFFKISIKGIQPEEYTMVFGFPGKTQEYLPSQAIRQIMEQGDPDKVKIRDMKLAILSSDMDQDAKVRIQYASKYASVSNAWKKWQGEIKGLRRLDAVNKKIASEQKFKTWVNSDSNRLNRYGEVLPNFEKLYTQIAPYSKANDFYTEIVQRGTDLFSIISVFEPLEKRWSNLSEAEQQKIENLLKSKLTGHFREYNEATDEKVFIALLELYNKEMDANFLSGEFKTLMHKGHQQEILKNIYKKSVFTDSLKLYELVSDLNAKKISSLSSDPAFKLFQTLKNYFYSNVDPIYNSLQKQINENQKVYMTGILEMNAGKPMWPDANKTLRVAYGKVEGYNPMDGVTYDYFTTLKGIMEKDNPKIYDYNVPQKLRDLYQQKDYGRYGHDGQMNVCFTASNHTTGGNSGSPVIDADGNLIGVNFDRCWEGTMSDLMFDPDRCRNIVLDIRYALFIIDKMARAGYLVNEMAIIE